MTPSPAALRILGDTFGLPRFRPGQVEVVAAAEAGRDVLLVAPTGAGKSIAYWVPGLIAGGLTLVVSPLIALMADQLARLQSHGIAAGAINSHVPRDEQLRVEEEAAAGRLRFLYVAPERFAARGFMAFLGQLRVSRFVVDEAHCISSWGHDFRPDYRRLGEAVQSCGRPAIGAFTATATPRVRSDIAASLGMRDPVVRVTGFVRPELMLRVVRCRGSQEKLVALSEALAPGGAGGDPGRAIVYCGRTRSTGEVADHLTSQGVSAAAYHGSLPAEQRRRVHEEFTAGRLRVIAATSAFGMGIDLPDIRQVIHLDFPGSIESYYQEAGRAGRDGLEATCTLLYSPADRDLQSFFIENAYPERDVVRAVYRELLRTGSWHLEDWGRRLPALDAQVVRAALDLLGRAGVLLDGGDIQRLDGSPVDFEEQATLREHAYARLHQMMEYARTRGCRHARIADYFGEEGVARTCESCDNCRSPVAAALVPVEPELVVLALGCVDRFDGHLGAARIAAILRGTVDAWARDKSWVQRLSFFGALSTWPGERIRDLLSELIETGCLRRTSGERPTLALTRLGRGVMSGQSAPAIDVPVSCSVGAAAITPAALDAESERRFQGLRAWRLEVARRDGVPAFTVFDDRTLREIAVRVPATPEALSGIRGIGPAKLARHGQDVLELLSV